MTDFIFNGNSFVQTVEKYAGEGTAIAVGKKGFLPAEADYEEKEIPGRNGVLTLDNERYKDVAGTYQCYIRSGYGAAKIPLATMLKQERGMYCRLEDDDEPQYYRMAKADKYEEIKTLFNDTARVDISFRCMPQRWLKRGENDTIHAGTGLGGKNLLPYPYHHTTRTEAGITWTDNGDGTVTAIGTATAFAVFSCHSRTSGEANDFTLGNGKYFVSGCPAGGGVGKYRIDVGVTKDGAWQSLGTDYGEGVEITVAGDDFDSQNVNLGFQLQVYNGVSVNTTFKPMIQRIDDPDHEWAPYDKNEIYNPTAFTAFPFLTIWASNSSDGWVKINDDMLEFSGLGSAGVTIDCELHIVKILGQTPGTISGPWPSLRPGQNIVTYGGSISGVLIQPRWWTL